MKQWKQNSKIQIIVLQNKYGSCIFQNCECSVDFDFSCNFFYFYFRRCFNVPVIELSFYDFMYHHSHLQLNRSGRFDASMPIKAIKGEYKFPEAPVNGKRFHTASTIAIAKTRVKKTKQKTTKQ